MSERLQRVAGDLLAGPEVRSAAQALAADGHLVSAREAMEDAAKLHSSASRLPDEEAAE